MLLWTWQNPKILPFKGEYDSLQHSDYVNDPRIAKSDRDRFIKAYREIWKRLGKKDEKIKIIWCYTSEEKAKEEKYPFKNKALWKLDVPEENIRYICSIAWNWILFGKGRTMPSKFKHLYEELTGRLFLSEQSEAFDRGWKKKMNKGELWDILFLDNLVEGCTTAIVIHPVKKTWFKKNYGFDEV